MIAQFNTITGADWRHSLVSNRARIAQKRVATESFIRRARESRLSMDGQLRPCPACRGYELESRWCDHCKRTGYIITNNTLAVGLADGAQGDPATGFYISVPHETTRPTAFNFPTMTGGTASQIQDNTRKAAETPEALRESL